MNLKHFTTGMLIAATTLATSCGTQKEETEFEYNDERFADLQMLRYKVEGFEDLSLRQKTLVYYLSQAALSGRDILWDQNGRYNLRIRQLLESIYTDYQGDRESEDFKQFVVYLKRVWFSNGIYHHYGCDKFQPGFSEDFLRTAMKDVAAEKLPFDTEELFQLVQRHLRPHGTAQAHQPSRRRGPGGHQRRKLLRAGRDTGRGRGLLPEDEGSRSRP